MTEAGTPARFYLVQSVLRQRTSDYEITNLDLLICFGLDQRTQLLQKCNNGGGLLSQTARAMRAAQQWVKGQQDGDGLKRSSLTVLGRMKGGRGGSALKLRAY